jgi:preprotein translocase subunit SecG
MTPLEELKQHVAKMKASNAELYASVDRMDQLLKRGTRWLVVLWIVTTVLGLVVRWWLS